MVRNSFKTKPFVGPMAVLCLIILGLLLVTASQAQASMCVVPPEARAWRNNNAATNSVTQLTFRMECRDAHHTTCNGNICSTTYGVEPHYYISMAGKCHPTDCPWGEVEGQALDGGSAGWYRFTYNQGFAKRDVMVRTYPQWPGWLRLWIHTDFTDPNRADYTTDEWFVPR